MRDARQRQDLDACLAAVRAGVGRAAANHARAVAAAAMAEAEAGRADMALADADRAWRDAIGEGFDPLLGELHARRVRHHAAVAADARGCRDEAATAQVRSAEAWHREDARRDALEEISAIARRRAGCRADERLLAMLADRETAKRRGR